MSAEPKPERGEFQMSWQVAAILALTMIAMAVPLLGVALLARGYFDARSAASSSPGSASVVASPPATAALTNALERTADQTLGANATALLGLEIKLVLPPDQIAARAARISELGRSAGGSGLEIPPAEGESVTRLILHVPKSRMDLLRRAIAGDPVDFSAIPASADGEILQVILSPP